MVDKKSTLLGKLYIVLLAINGIMMFETDRDILYLFIDILFIVMAFLAFPKLRQEDIRVLIIFLGWTVITLPITDGGIGSVLTFVASTALLIAYSPMCFDETMKKVLIVGCLAGCIWMYRLSIPYSENYILAKYFNKNSNVISMFSIYYFMILGVLTDLSKRKGKLLFLVAGVITTGALINCRGRAAIIAAAAYVVFLLIPNRKWTPKRIMQLLTTIVVIGTSIPILYVLFYREGSDIQIFGKPLFTGREEIWTEMFKLFKQKGFSFLIGLGSKVQLWNKETNVHNNYFNIIANFGIIGYALYFFAVFRFVRRASEGVRDETIRKALLAFICATLVLGFFESTSFNNALAPFTCFGLIYANGRLHNEKMMAMQTEQSL